MRDRINQDMLEKRCNYLNKITGNPKAPWTRKDGKTTGNIGNYHIDMAYGGCKVVQMDNECGGITNVTCGFNTKRETYDLLNSFIDGIIAGKELNK